MKAIIWLLGVFALLVVGTCVYVGSGAYNVAADEPHWPLTASALETARERSVASHASGTVVPDLGDESLIRDGAGNYDAMCVACHLRPGEEQSEMSAGLNPAPPNLSRQAIDEPAEAFWTIKHGIKMTGMPAWGGSMDDKYVWGLVAFLQQLPKLSEDRYDTLVASSRGHIHGDAETEAPAPDAASAAKKEAAPHQHADDKPHTH